MRNLGPKSRAWLASIGVFSLEDLRARGSVAVYFHLKASGFPVSKNLLWALLGAEWDLHWSCIPAELKTSALTELAKREHPPER